MFNEKVPTVIEALKKKKKGVNVIGHEDGSDVLEPINGGIENAVALAKQADIVLLAVGEASEMSGDAADAAGKPVFVLLNNERPILLKWLQEHFHGSLDQWQVLQLPIFSLANTIHLVN